MEKKEEERFLRQPTAIFEFTPSGATANGTAWSRQELLELTRRMKKIMHFANGIGLSANQIGLNCRLFVGQVPGERGPGKFYAVFNPQIQKSDRGKPSGEEGCLSVPGVYGEVERAEEVTLAGFDYRGRPLRIKAWGLLARMFQHEVDHLNGALFIDKAKSLARAPQSERLARKLEEEK